VPPRPNPVRLSPTAATTAPDRPPAIREHEDRAGSAPDVVAKSRTITPGFPPRPDNSKMQSGPRRLQLITARSHVSPRIVSTSAPFSTSNSTR
jgi:hypothetical protein